MGLYERLRIDARTVGATHNEWTQIGPTFSLPASGRLRKRVAVYECHCGTVAVRTEIHIRLGRTKTCWRCRSSKLIAAVITHGRSRTREYVIWGGIKRRCRNKRCREYADYGGRGIDIYQLWHDSFEAFLRDVGLAPTDEHQIDRIDNDRGYEPGNVRWALRTTNTRNTRRTRWIEFKGATTTIPALSEECGISQSLLRNRIKRGWSVEDAATIPPDRNNARRWGKAVVK